MAMASSHSSETVDHPEPSGLSVAVLDSCNHPDLAAKLRDGEFFWLHLEDPSDAELDGLGHQFHFHPLSVKAAKTFNQRPKLDVYDQYAYLVYYGAHPRGSQKELLHEVHLFISGDYIITIHRGEDTALTDLRETVSQRTVKSKQFLIYEVLASIADSYFPLLASLDEELDTLGDEILDNPSTGQLKRINALRHELTTMRRVVTPQRDIFARNIDELHELDGLEGDHPEYFRDIYDHLIRVSDLVDSYRDLASGATDLYLSTVANKQGEVGKQLAIIATIFLPLSFLTGFFGQNFSFLTNKIQNSPVAFVLLGIGPLVVSISVMVWFFRHKGWLGDTTAARGRTDDPV
jgi:magnesium transporter